MVHNSSAQLNHVIPEDNSLRSARILRVGDVVEHHFRVVIGIPERAQKATTSTIVLKGRTTGSDAIAKSVGKRRSSVIVHR